MRMSLAAQRSATQLLLASSGLPLMTEDEEAAYGNLKQVSPIPTHPITHPQDTYLQVARDLTNAARCLRCR
jgi:hypothetical protein